MLLEENHKKLDGFDVNPSKTEYQNDEVRLCLRDSQLDVITLG